MSALRTYLIALAISLWVSGAGLVRAEKIIFAYPSPNSTSFLPLVVAQKKGFLRSGKPATGNWCRFDPRLPFPEA